MTATINNQTGTGRGTTMAAIYRVSDGVLQRKHLAFSAVQPAFCGRVPKDADGGKMRWRTMSNPKHELPKGTKMCHQCASSPLNTPEESVTND